MKTNKDIKDKQPTPLQEAELQSAPLGVPEIKEADSGATETPTLWTEVDTADRKLPGAFHISRYTNRNRGAAEKYIQEHYLFDELDEQLKEQDTKQLLSGGSIVPIRGITKQQLGAVNFAIARALYNTSYALKTTDYNTGLIIDGRLDGGKGAIAKPINNQFREGDRWAQIQESLSALTATAFGLTKGEKPTSQQKKIVARTLSVLQKGTEMILPNGDKITESLLWIRRKWERKKDGAVFYDIILSPFYNMEIQKGFAVYPQDITQRMRLNIQRQTEADWEILSLLAAQDKRKPCERYKRELLQELGLWEEYLKQGAKRTNIKLQRLFENMIKVGILSPSAPDGGSNPKETTGGNGELKYIFYLNPDFIEKDKRITIRDKA